MVNAEFRGNVDALVDNALKQVWSDVEELHLGSTRVNDIAPLAGLKSLEWLYLRDTQVTNINSLDHLQGLTIRR